MDDPTLDQDAPPSPPPVIRALDFETTGMEPGSEVCEVGTCDLMRESSGWVVCKPSAHFCGVSSMPPEVRAIHHISLAEVKGHLPFDPGAFWVEAIAHDVVVVAAHNAEFEAQFLGEPRLPLLCTYKAALRVWPQAPSHSNGALRYWLEDKGETGRTIRSPCRRTAPGRTPT